MKKTIFILLLAFSSFGTWAQNHPDTVSVFYRDPRYYYWDSNWVDSQIRRCIADGNTNIHWANISIPVCTRIQLATEIARYFHTDSALRVIGIAAARSGHHLRVPRHLQARQRP